MIITFNTFLWLAETVILEGILEIPQLKGVEIKIEVEGKEVFQEEALLFLVLNGKSAGRFNHLAPDVSVTDGYWIVFFLKSVLALTL